MRCYLQHETELRFLLNDKSFNTDECVRIAVYRSVDADARNEHILYKSPGGSYFLHLHGVIKSGRGKPFPTDSFRELTPAEAIAWLGATGAVIVDASVGGLTLPPQA